MEIMKDEVSPTLREQMKHHEPIVCYPKEPITLDVFHLTSMRDGAQILKARDYKDPQIVCYGISAYDSNSMKSSNPHSGIYLADTSRTLDLNGGNPACNQGGMMVVQWVKK